VDSYLRSPIYSISMPLEAVSQFFSDSLVITCPF
jgi:hypothetical protein